MNASRAVNSTAPTRARKARRAGTALALAAAATFGGLALATPANAAHIGTVEYQVATYEEVINSDGRGWDECTNKYPQTKSAALNDWASNYDPEQDLITGYTVRYNCFDDPNKTW